MISIDLNCDLGEGAVSDAVELSLLDCVTSANIACAGHAGDPDTIKRLARACIARDVGIGAHPSYPDRANFGRISLRMSADAVADAVESQLRVFAAALADVSGAHLAHIKPHGALYHDAMSNQAIADAFARAAMLVAPGATLVAQPNTLGAARWRDAGIPVAHEAFADRRYEPDSTLRSRGLHGALLTSPEEAASQALSIARDHRVTASDGSVVPVSASTICIHSDTPGAAHVAQAVRRNLQDAGLRVRRMSTEHS